MHLVAGILDEKNFDNVELISCRLLKVFHLKKTSSMSMMKWKTGFVYGMIN